MILSHCIISISPLYLHYVTGDELLVIYWWYDEYTYIYKYNYDYIPILYPLYTHYIAIIYDLSDLGMVMVAPGFLHSEAMDENGSLRMIYRVKNVN